MKRLLLVLVLCLSLCMSGSAWAADMAAVFDGIGLENYRGSVILSADTDVALVGGVTQRISRPVVRGGRIWLPIRSVAEVLGCQVNFSDGVIEIINGSDVLTMRPGSVDATYNGSALRLSGMPYVEGGITWLPMRTVGELLHKQVDWENRYQDYSAEGNYLPHSLIFIYDAKSNFPTKNNTTGINHFYDCCLALLYEQEVIFANQYITVWRENNRVYLQDSYYPGAKAQVLNEGALPADTGGEITDVLDKQNGFENGAIVWLEAGDGWLLCRNEPVAWDLRGRTVLYYLDSKDLREANWYCAAEEVNFAAIQVLANGVLTLYHFDSDDVWDYNRTNLAYYDFAEKQKKMLGAAGYFYGFDLQGNYQGLRIENGKIEIFGYDRRMGISESERSGSYKEYGLAIPFGQRRG